jgi:hypothetical protein
MKKFTLFLTAALAGFAAQAADTLHLSSPGKQTHLTTWFDKGVQL